MYSSAYLIVGDELRPKKPQHCISCVDFGRICRIRIKAWRQRKVGIEHPLMVFRCRDHGICFTAYPQGWTQYGRRPLVDVSPDGWDLDETGDDSDKSSDGDTSNRDVVTWQGTAFGAALDAACGKKWPQTSCEALRFIEPKPYGVFATQIRHIAGVVRLFRLDAESDDKARELVCARLPVSQRALVVSASRVRDGPTEGRWQREGREGWATTQKLRPPRRWLKHLLALGAVLGFWGSPVYG